jgi:MFS family permease
MTSPSSAGITPGHDESLSYRYIPAANRFSILLFGLVNFLWWIGLYIYVPIFPVYIQETGAGLGTVGVILSAYAIPQVLLRIPLGIWSDRLRNRKPVVAGGIIFTSIGALGLSLATNPWLLFLSRFVTGIGAATWVVFPLYFNAYYPANDSGRAIGIINFIRNIALITATAASGFIAEGFGLSRPFLIAALLGFPALVVLLLTRETPLLKDSALSRETTLSIATRPLLLVVSLMGILLLFAMFTGVFGFIPIYAADIGASDSQLGIITMINLGVSAIGTLLAVWIWERLGFRFTIILSGLLIGISMAAIPSIDTTWGLMAIQTSYGLGSGILTTLFMVLSIRGLPQHQQATAMGVFQAFYAVGMLAGPLISGFLGSGLGLSNVFYLSASLTLLIAVLALLPVFSRRSLG